MHKSRHQPIAHPGEILEMILEENGISQTTLAKHIGLPQTKISEICRKKRGISAEMATKLAKAMGMSASLWLNIQKNWELAQVDQRKLARVRRIRGLSGAEEKFAA